MARQTQAVPGAEVAPPLHKQLAANDGVELPPGVVGTVVAMHHCQLWLISACLGVRRASTLQGVRNHQLRFALREGLSVLRKERWHELELELNFFVRLYG